MRLLYLLAVYLAAPIISLMVGLQAQVSRLEIASTLVEYDKGNALLITGLEIIPTQTVPALRLGADAPAAESQLLALQSLAEAIIATDKDGRVTFMGGGPAGSSGARKNNARALPCAGARRVFDLSGSGR